MELSKNYRDILQSLKEKIRHANLRASITVNAQLLRLYWEIGHTILEQQKKEGWGTKVIDRLTKDLKSSFPDMKGLSPRNIKYMRAFAEAYPDFAIVQVPLAQLSWYHHLTLLDKVKDRATRLFYVEKAVQNGWSRNTMVSQIEGRLHKRQGKAMAALVV